MRMNSFRKTIAVAILPLAACGSAYAQVAGDILDRDIAGRIESQVTDTIEDRLETRVETAVTERLEGEVRGRLMETVETAETPTRTFVGALDEGGWTIERDTWVMLIEPDYLPRIERWGFTVEERRPLEGLGLVLVRLDAPDDRDLERVAAKIALEAPGTVVDHNHLYRTDARDEAENAANCARTPDEAWSPPAGRRIDIGIVDTAVATDHPALKSADIVHKDFVPFERAEPLDHGTAVASILVGQSDELRGRLPGARLHAASVFFRDGEGGIGATTASLVQALAWLDETGVPVVNMSLSGPPNRLLEKVIDRMTANGTIVIAAVGNNGPAGRPLYPAAYEPVVGITAVDACHRIFRYANRGRQVAFSAPGVSIRVARGDGGYGFEQGTSMAAPYAAAVIAATLAASPNESGIVEKLETAALDLGEPGFDDVFGFGLIGPPR